MCVTRFAAAKGALVACAALVLCGGEAWAESRQMVGVSAGVVDSIHRELSAVAEGTLLLGDRYKVQLDVAGGVAERSPLVALGLRISRPVGRTFRLGITSVAAARTRGNGELLARLGAEGEAFVFRRLVVRAEAGYQAGDVSRNGYAQASGTLYLHQDLSFEVGGEFVSGDEDILRARVEWRPRRFGGGRTSFNVDVLQDPGDENTAVSIGVRFALSGAPESLWRERRTGHRRGVLYPALTFVTNARRAH